MSCMNEVVGWPAAGICGGGLFSNACMLPMNCPAGCTNAGGSKSMGNFVTRGLSARMLRTRFWMRIGFC